MKRGAVGQFALGEHRSVFENGSERFEYDVRCEDCGVVLGFLRSDLPRVHHDPADCGLVCNPCNTLREEE